MEQVSGREGLMKKTRTLHHGRWSLVTLDNHILNFIKTMRESMYGRRGKEDGPCRHFPIGPKLNFHMPIDERISNNFCNSDNISSSIPHNHDDLKELRGAKARVSPLRLPGQHLYEMPSHI